MNETAKYPQDNLDFADEIIRWWTLQGRNFPWRRTNDPFKILVAEILLQRSRSGSVTKVYLDLFERWPSAKNLAEADILEIETRINSLGFKSRALRLKNLAAIWSHRSIPPNNSKELQELPGVGPYSANATAIAMSWDSDPCVDSVSIRVLRRYRGNQTKRPSDQRIASITYSGIPKNRWRKLNWAILDLAAALCMPRIPRCSSCPLESRCKWAQKHRQKPI